MAGGGTGTLTSFSIRKWKPQERGTVILKKEKNCIDPKYSSHSKDKKRCFVLNPVGDQHGFWLPIKIHSTIQVNTLRSYSYETKKVIIYVTYQTFVDTTGWQFIAKQEKESAVGSDAIRCLLSVYNSRN